MMDHIKFRYENSITHRLLYFYERTKPEEVAAEKKEEAASEDKAAIVKALLRALQMTRLGITDMTYRCDKCNSEIVFVTFADGSKKLINVTADSGTQLIRDIVERIS
jgi:hypothetical protein